jgi:hypothetical protein
MDGPALTFTVGAGLSMRQCNEAGSALTGAAC